MSYLFPFLLQSASVKASVGPESGGWFYAFLPSLVQVLKKGPRPWVGNVLLVPDVPQTLCDLGQVTLSSCVSLSSSVKWELVSSRSLTFRFPIYQKFLKAVRVCDFKRPDRHFAGKELTGSTELFAFDQHYINVLGC